MKKLNTKIISALLNSRNIPVKKELTDSENKYLNYLWHNVVPDYGEEQQNFKRQNKRMLETVARQYGITNQNEVKELTELFLVIESRNIADTHWNNQEGAYWKIVQLYNSQVNLSHRTSQSIMLQQYSTPAPIAYLAGLFCRKNKAGYMFEPSAGNGMLTISFSPQKTVVNEIDSIRNKNLQTQDFLAVTAMDASRPFTMFEKTFDFIITNPPFGSIDAEEIDGVKFKTLDHVMAIYALQAMKDDGRAAIIVGGHTDYDAEGRIQSGKNRIFLSYLWKHYKISDTINIDGGLYSRMGTSFNVRLILVNGRKIEPGGFPPLYEGNMLINQRYNPEPIKNFLDLYNRVLISL